MAAPPIINVPFEELAGSPVENTDENGEFTGIRTLVCAWDERLQLQRELLGTAPISGNFTAPGIWPWHADEGERNPGRAVAIESVEPFFEDQVRDKTGCKGTPGTADQATYDHALIRVRYRRVQLDEDDGGGGGSGGEVLVEERLEGEHELLTLPHKQIAWESGFGATPAQKALFPIDDAEVPARVLANAAWVVTLYRVRTPLSINFLNHLGKVNQGAIISKRYGLVFAANTLLYTDFSSQASVNSADGDEIVTMEVRFSYRENKRLLDNAVLGWNGFWRAACSDFDRLVEYEQGQSSGVPTAGDPILLPTAPFTDLGLRLYTG